MNAESANPTQIVNTSHYNWHPSGIECRQFVRLLPYNLGTAVAYVWRAGRKSGVPAWDDLRKAAQHLDYIAQGDEASLFHETRGFDPRTGDLVEKIDAATPTREGWLREILFLVASVSKESSVRGVRLMLNDTIRFLRDQADRVQASDGKVEEPKRRPRILFTGDERTLFMPQHQTSIKCALAVGLSELLRYRVSSFTADDVVRAALKTSNGIATIDPESARVALAILAEDPQTEEIFRHRKIRKIAQEPEDLWAFAEGPDQTSQSSQSPSESSPSESSSSR